MTGRRLDHYQAVAGLATPSLGSLPRSPISAVPFPTSTVSIGLTSSAPNPGPASSNPAWTTILVLDRINVTRDGSRRTVPKGEVGGLADGDGICVPA